MQAVPVVYDLDEHGEAIHVHWFCSHECRLKMPGVLSRPVHALQLDPNYPETTQCETCGLEVDRERSYHFNLGDSFKGPVGYCARVQATSKQEAVERLRNALDVYWHDDGLKAFDDLVDDGEPPAPGVEYIRCYMNPENVTVDDIDEVTEVDDIDAL